MTINKLNKSCPRIKKSGSSLKKSSQNSVKFFYKPCNEQECHYSIIEMMEAIEDWINTKYCPSYFDPTSMNGIYEWYHLYGKLSTRQKEAVENVFNVFRIKEYANTFVRILK